VNRWRLRRLFDFIDHRDREIFHRDATLSLRIAQQLVVPQPKMS